MDSKIVKWLKNAPQNDILVNGVVLLLYGATGMYSSRLYDIIDWNYSVIFRYAPYGLSPFDFLKDTRPAVGNVNP